MKSKSISVPKIKSISAASDHGTHCLLRPVCANIYVFTVDSFYMVAVGAGFYGEVNRMVELFHEIKQHTPRLVQSLDGCP